MSSKLLSFFFPNTCIICDKSIKWNRYACEACKTDIYYIGRNSVCKTCYAPIPEGEVQCGACILRPPQYEKLVSCVYFKDGIRTALHRYKFRGRSDLHSSFSNLLIERLKDIGCTDFDAVVPVPLSKERFRERGYNQSGLIAKDIASHFGAIYNKEAIFRKRHTGRQSELAHKYREANVRGAFSLGNAEALAGKHILLIDDIFTTGSTLREVSRVLSKSGCRITAATIAVSVGNAKVSSEN